MNTNDWDPESEFQVRLEGRALFVDIDKTLIMPFDTEEEGEEYASQLDEDLDWTRIDGVVYRILRKNVYMVKRFAASDGVEIVFWSAGGGKWASQVADALGISDLSSVFIPKPSWYLDDLKDAGFAEHGDKFINAVKGW